MHVQTKYGFSGAGAPAAGNGFTETDHFDAFVREEKSHSVAGRAPLRLNDPRICAVVALADAVTLFASALAVWFLYHLIKGGDFSDWQVYLTSSTVLAVLFVTLALSGRTYNFIWELRRTEAIGETLKCYLGTFAVYVTVLFFFRYGATFSRATLAGQFVVCGLLLLFVRAHVLRILQQQVRSGKLTTFSAVLIGTAETIRNFRAGAPNDITQAGIVAAFEVETGGNGRFATETIDHAAARCRELRPDRVVVLLPDGGNGAAHDVVLRLAKLPVSVLVAPAGDLPWGEKARVVEFGGRRMLRVVARPLTAADRVMKRAFDAGASALALLVLALPMALLIAAIRIESPGPAIFRQKRRGFNQEEFTLYKLRTMVVAPEGATFRQTQKADPRVTRLGRLLRKYNLDELPQLYNVLKGEMSLVGPRPHAVEHDMQYVSEIEAYANRNRMKPGLTGLAQINGFRGATETVQQMADRVRLDVTYIENWSMTLDLKIIVLTVFSPQAFRNAY
jgi:Undecaprenyl-phosphate glucose phosphotransferase